jgi:tetratricopeptide (TPR) repeat protein
MAGIRASNALPRRFSLLALLIVSLLFALARPNGSAAQDVGPEPASVPGGEQLTRVISECEAFLASATATTPVSALRDVRTRLATAYLMLHRYADSLRVLQPLEAAQPGGLPAPAWAVKGIDELELNQLSAAIHSLRRAVTINPDLPSARLALGDALARSDRMEEAARVYEKQTMLTPSLADAWYKLGLAHSQIASELPHQQVKAAEQPVLLQLTAEELIAKGDNLDAARVLFRMLRQSPEQAEVHAELGTSLLALGYTKAAEDHFHQELVKNPVSPLSHLGLAQTAALKGDWKEVTAEFQILSRTEPREFTRLLEFPAAGLILQASAGGRLNPPQEFAESISGSIWKNWLSDSSLIARITPTAAEGIRQRCAANQASTAPGPWLKQDCYESLRLRLRAQKELRNTEKTKLAEAEFRLGNYAAALRTAENVRASDRQNAWGIYWLSKAHDALSEQCFLKLGALNPDSARVHQMLADHYLKLSDYPKAKSEYESALHLSPNSPELHLGLGTVLSRMSDLPSAEKELKTTLDLAPNSDFAHYELGHVYVKESAWPDAIAQLREVPDTSSSVLSARLDLSKAESELGMTAEAVQDLLSVASRDHDGELYFRLATLYRRIGKDSESREALATFRRLRSASLDADTDELGALEKEQTADSGEIPRSR